MENSKIIFTCTENELTQIAALHQHNISAGFLSSLGENFLQLIYSSIQEKGILIAALENNQVIGFVSGAVRLQDVYQSFVRRNFFKSLFFLLPKLISFRVFRKLVELILYPFSKKDDSLPLPTAELLTMVVDEDHRGKKISERLYQELVTKFKEKNIMEFKIMVGGNLIHAQKFYEKMGAVRYKQIFIHKGENSWIYIHRIV